MSEIGKSMSDTILSFKNVNKSFFGVQVLKDISLDIERGHIVGLIGENGAGKSTLMNILGGVVPLDSGNMILDGSDYIPRNPEAATRAGIAFIHQELNLFTNLSIAENFFINNFPTLGKTPLLARRKIQAKAKDFLEQVDLKVSADTLVEALSPGERQLVEVAKALSQDARIIIFDEPTTSLTARETDRLFELIARLKASGKTIIYISHILRDVMQITDDVAILRDGELVQAGQRSEFSIQKMISGMVGRDINQLYPDREGKQTDEVALDVCHVSHAGLVHDINFSLHRGEILGVFGLMGSGRSELAQIIFGLEKLDQGKITINGQDVSNGHPQKSIREGLAFVTENRREEGLMMTATVAENMGLVALPDFVATFIQVVRIKPLGEAIRESIASLKVKVNKPFKNQVKGLSGGNQQKVVLGKWLMTKPNILIVDEPTRGVDVGAKYEIYGIINHIADNGTAVMFISSEIEELMGVCDRIIVMGVGEVHGTFEREHFNKEEILRTAFRENGK
ncbi:MAG: sugar ABC transporter ATP-binding protein [Anaerolineaceae bacterium]|nr:sugar ABC transporter ATP-binding protein [Anaerolineaceae bacterium]